MASTSYLGCYEDKSTDRDLPNKAGTDNEMVPMKCFAMCKLFKSNFLGLQKGNECWCGNEYGFHGKVLDKYCEMPCPGDKEKICGGKRYNAVYTGPFNGLPKAYKLEAEDSHLQKK